MAKLAGTEPESDTAAGAASSFSPVSPAGFAPAESGASESGALEIGVSGRAIAMGYYTGVIVLNLKG